MVFENVDFYNWLNWFEGVGGFDIILPFLLIFAVTFAILQKIKLFGVDDKSRKIDMIISLIIAFFLVMQQELVAVIQGFLPRVSMLILVLLMILLVVGIFAGGAEWGGSISGLAVIVAIVGVLWAIGASLKWNVPFLDLFTEQDVAVIIVIGIFVLVIWLIVKEPREDDKGISKALEGLGRAVKGK